MPDLLQTDFQRALEALRNGVPNRDAVCVLGCNQPHVEARFKKQLAEVATKMQAASQPKGMLIQGGFGTGKSHLLEYLQHHAVATNFVCSRVVISKETPLYDPAKVFLAAIDTAVASGIQGQAMQEIALRLHPNEGSYAEFYQWANRADGRVSNLFPATLLLHERLNNDPELLEEVTAFWAGQKLSIQKIKQGLKQAGAANVFKINPVPVRELALQRFLFAARLIVAAGFAGWVLLIDEVELVGRYSLMQRAKAYAELARWLGAIPHDQYPGLTAVAAITDDYAPYVLEERGDRTLVPSRLQEKGTDDAVALLKPAQIGIREIREEAVHLDPPNRQTLVATYKRLKDIHGKAYDWEPTDISGAESAPGPRPMRTYVRRWINEWDLLRLYPAEVPDTEEGTVSISYAEDAELESNEGEDSQ
jgi:hypothetical protein